MVPHQGVGTAPGALDELGVLRRLVTHLPAMVAFSGALAGEEQPFERTLVDALGRARHTQAHHVPEVQRPARVGSWTERRTAGALAWSDGMYRIFGLPEDTLPTREAVLDLVRPDGEVRHVHGRTSVVVHDGAVLARRGILVDETEVQESRLAWPRSTGACPTWPG